jgi:hypothetical protein
MAVKVYCWKSRLIQGSTGHAAMAISDKSYIRFWPVRGLRIGSTTSSGRAEVDLTLGNRKLVHSLEDDRHRLHGPPTNVVCIEGLPESDMRDYWHEVAHAPYVLTDFNCCQMVGLVLWHGAMRYAMSSPMNTLHRIMSNGLESFVGSLGRNLGTFTIGYPMLAARMINIYKHRDKYEGLPDHLVSIYKDPFKMFITNAVSNPSAVLAMAEGVKATVEDS